MGLLGTTEARGMFHIFLNILIWSFFPLFSKGAVDSAGIWATAFYSQVAGFVLCALFAKRKPLSQVKADLAKAPVMLAILSMASLFISVAFMSSLLRAGSVSATIALELWPLFALFFAATFIRKQWAGLNWFTVGLFFVGALGIVLLATVEDGDLIGYRGGSHFLSQPTGVLLAVVASIFSGATVVQTELYYRYEDEPSFGGAFYTIMLCRAVAIPVALLGVVFSGGSLADQDALIWGCLLGISAYGLASVLAISGLRYTSNILHILMWYMTPVLASLWLILFKGEYLTDAHVLAFMPILIANIFSNLKKIRRRSYFVTAFVAMGSGALIYWWDGVPSNDYYDALSILVGAFSIIVSFVLYRKMEDIRNIAFSLRDAIGVLADGTRKRDEALQLVEDIVMNQPTAGEARKSEAKAYEPISTIRIERFTSFASAEVVVLTVLSSTIIGIAVGFRAQGFVGDMVAFALCIASVFLTLFAIECSSFRFQWKMAKQVFTGESGNWLKDQERVMSVAGIALAYLLACLLLIDKWLYDILRNILISLPPG